MRYIDLNTDTGESFGRWRLGDDEELLSYVSSANIACGMHAGDPVIMDSVVSSCISRGIAVGAHPSFPDLQGFGRREMSMTPTEIERYVMYQIGALRCFVESHGGRLTHVKPHGALYNMAARDEQIALAVARGVARSGQELILVGLAGSLSLWAAQKVGLAAASEGFCDRAYNPDGTLVSRGEPGSVITDLDQIARRAVSMARDGIVLSRDGKPIEIHVDTLCIHSDTPGATAIARIVRKALEEAGISVTRMDSIPGLRR